MRKRVIEVNQLSKSFKKQHALKNIQFHVSEGEIFGFLGPSGSGKTTTIKILTGQLAQTSGQAFVLGNPVEKIDESIYEDVGIVTDNSGLYERLSVYNNLTAFAKLLKVKKSRIDVLLKEMGLYEHKNKLANQLSKGMKQRLVLARSMLHEPKVLFLDEPTSGLDPVTTEAIHSLLMELKANGTTIFLTTHNMDEATKLCDHVALLNDGLIVENDSPKALTLKYNKEKRYSVLLSNEVEHVLPHSPDTVEQINQWLKNDEILTIHSCEPDLEAVFLEVTGRELI
ncbi:ABC-2 type transport system ATP-binding protein [Alkalihalobacillus xiaoxiensis]|uniref:ABC-2 type transport system ATP-binding protein n=1 Tax=Shouchella xiaoxiensis TaxID=766895 RepID=A0ABS2SQ98_9BACI|nr:ABC transporter ATP-binding protein [Shouchella xiaoxiensis]MBM7836985.1 ABC-2 type transport system ATP-binding protein [Shouchella xiaoxiensis]